MNWIQVAPDITLINVTSLINFLLNSYFENPTVKLYVLYILNMHAMVGLHLYAFLTHSNLLKTNFSLQKKKKKKKNLI